MSNEKDKKKFALPHKSFVSMDQDGPYEEAVIKVSLTKDSMETDGINDYCRLVLNESQAVVMIEILQDFVKQAKEGGFWSTQDIL